MKKVQLFSASNIEALQYQVNEWLSTNKGIEILHTSMNSFATIKAENGETEQHTFYILYSSIPHPVAEAVAIMEESIPKVDIPNLELENGRPTNSN